MTQRETLAKNKRQRKILLKEHKTLKASRPEIKWYCDNEKLRVHYLKESELSNKINILNDKIRKLEQR